MKPECLLAPLTGCLIYFAYICPVGAATLPVCICFLCYQIANIRSLWRRCLFFFLMYLVWSALQLSFLIKKTLSEDSPVSLLIIAIAALLVSFAIPVLYFGRRRPVESAILALLVSDFFFSVMPIGNDFFLIGLPFAYFTEIIQWAKYTGPHFISFWVVISGYFLYRYLVLKTIIPFLKIVVVLVVPVCVSFLITCGEKNSLSHESCKNIAVMGLTNEDGCEFVSTYMKNVSLRGCDCFLLPEGFIFTKDSDTEYSPSVTMLKRLSKRDSVYVIYGMMTEQKDFYTNSVRMDLPDGRQVVRYKSHLIPFSEYLPFPQLFSRISFVVDNMPYCLSNGQNCEDIWSMPDGHNVAAMICYEALSPSFMSDMVRKGAELLFVSASCTWIGSRHFERVSSLLLKTSAMITSRSVVRSARDGISMFIDRKGKIEKKSENSADLLMASVSLSDEWTCYVRNRIIIDYIYGALLLLSFIFLVSNRIV